MFSSIFVTSLYGATAIAQDPIPSDPPGSPKDTNPYNVANWEPIASTGSHIATGTSWYKDETGVHSDVTETVYVPIPETVSATSIPSNTSGESYSAKMEVAVSVKMRRHWIGVGPAPTKLWVIKTATAWGKVSPNGTVTLSNGLGSSTVLATEPDGKRYTCTGSKLEQVDVTTGGIVEVEFTGSAVATATGTGPLYLNSADANFYCTFTPKGAATSFSHPNYRNVNGVKTLNGPFDQRTDVAGKKTTFGDLYVSVWIDRVLYGGWENPFHSWVVGGEFSYIDDLIHEYVSVPLAKDYSSAASKALTQSKQTYNVQLSLQDITNPETLGGPIPLQHQIHVYAPIYKSHIVATPKDLLWTVVAQAGIDPPILTNNSAAVQYNYAQAISSVYGYIANSAQGGGALAGQPWLEAVGSAIGIIGDALESKAESDTPSFNDCYADPDSQFVGTKVDPMSLWKMTDAERIVKYINVFSEAEKYDPLNGFEGYTDDITKIINEAKTVGVFRKINPSGGGNPGNGA